MPEPFLQTQAPASVQAPAAPPAAPKADDGISSPQPASSAAPAPAAAPQPAPTFADLLHKALDAFAAAPLEGRDVKERRELRAAVADLYGTRQYAPLWLDDGKPNAAAKSAMARLAHAGDDGLSLDGMPAPVFTQDADGLATAEINLTMQVVAYARQASGSRIEPLRIGRLIGAKPAIPAPSAILTSVAAAGADAGTVLEAFNPPQAGYRALRDKLAELRREMPTARGPIPRGPTLRVGMSDPRVPLIRAKFGLDTAQESASKNLRYDTRVAAAVAHFQKAYGLPASGVLTTRTIAALSGGQPSRLEAELIANMEMWRWMPRDMGKNRIEVNIPDFTVRAFRDDKMVWSNKVIVGKPKTPTPVFSSLIHYVIVNPYWNVPPSIVRKEMLPKLEQDPTYLARMGFETFTRHGHLVVRQPPGPKNALGRIKFIFPNDYAVYLHDTPARHLFNDKRRAFSHGCVRVDEPFGLAQAVFGPDSRWTEQRVERLVGGARHYINLPEPMPIHIEYFTAFVDADNHLQLRDDLYGYTRKVALALGLESRRLQGHEAVSIESRRIKRRRSAQPERPSEFAPD
ncbi:MAG: L,D-transpeptidase [Beijerinckiaceae bacterium]|nr:MAG: L,D-transpeptidase [Beijerinckiaceae bacterium]